MLDIPLEQGLTQYDFSQKSILWGQGFNQKPIVVQILRVINIGVSQSSGGAAEEDATDSEGEGSGEEAQPERFENKYLEACD